MITPILPGRLEFWLSDTDRVRIQADERLNAVLAHMERMDVAAVGRIGDDDPLTAFDDAVRDFRPDHILIALRGADHAGWQERGLLDRVRDRFHLPITIFEITVGGHVPRTVE